jgi:mono/diheme cytochrome c family protein
MSGIGLRSEHCRAVLIALAAGGWLAADEPAVVSGARPSITFENDIAPILEARCTKCHGQDRTEAGLDLRRRFTLLKGGENGTAIVPGKPDESLLVRRIEAGEMPPKDEGRLDERQRSIIRRWVADGAALANPREQPLDDLDAAHRVSEADRRFWAFQPPVRSTPPAVAGADRVRTPIDAFLLAKLEPAGLSFNHDAPREVLLRRLSLDLLGLPPTLEDLRQFLADDRPDAYERLVDRLLASPRYGERWARHWLDVAGYADSDGYLAADRPRPEAWRFRDYVIAAHNDDLPFDRFLTEQIAGDELSDWRRADELSDEMTRQLTATGFLRTALDPTYPGYTEPNEIHQVISDTVQIVGTTFLGLTIQCARCHSHKFDPISQRDYYSLQSFFLPALDPARWQPSEVRGIVMATDAQAARIREHNQKADERINYLNATQADLIARFRKKRIADELVETRGAVDPALLEKLTAALAQSAEKRNEEQKTLVVRHVPTLTVAEADLAGRYADFKEEAERLKAAVAAEQALRKQPVLVRGLVDIDEKPPMARLLTRGDYTKPGPTVEPAVPEVLRSGGDALLVSGSYKTTGRRLALARWLTEPGNPLTARVQVNRLWAHHFGRGIVPTVANFGRSGAAPSHPELLDWLAIEFASRGWSMKAMHRLMVTSTAYRQTAAVDSVKLAADPENLLLGAWQPRRVEGEVLRDSVLAVAGKLRDRMFGSATPVVAQPDGSVVTADDEAGNRRSVYLIVRRSQHLTMFDLFDTPMMEVNCPQRNISTVPMQALAMLHGPFTERAASALADRIQSAVSAGDSARIDFAYRLMFARPARATETQAMLLSLAAMEQDQLVARGAAATDADRAAARQAAWTQIALVLLNTNEFVYVH